MANDEDRPAKRMRYSSDVEPPAVKPSKRVFMMLNPDCHLEIFEYLHLDDLIGIAEVNLALKSLATYYFHLKYRHFNCYSLVKDAPVSIEQVKKLLSNFGDQIVSLHMSRSIFLQTKHISSDLLLWAKRYCSANMKALTLEGFEMESRLKKTLNSLVHHIETLKLVDCDFQAFLWWTAENLKCLQLEATTFQWQELYKASFKQLEDVQFINLFGNNQSMVRFILSVPMLKHLSIVDCKVTTNIFWTIGQLQQLEVFEFHRNDSNMKENFLLDLQHLTSLKRLKVLRLNCEKRSVHGLLGGFVEKGIAIEELELAYGQIDDATVRSISKLNSIKILKLNKMIGLSESHVLQMTNGLEFLEELCIQTQAKISDFGIKRIVQRLNELTTIKIDSPGFLLSTYIYRAMVAIMRTRVNQTSLNITIYSNGGRLLVLDEVLEATENSRWVNVKELDRDNNHIFPYYNGDSDDDDDDTDGDDEE